MRFTTSQYAHREEISVSIRNQNTSNVIVDGQPVFYISGDIIISDNAATAQPGTDLTSGPVNFLGIDVTTPSDISTTQKTTWGLFAGIAKVQNAAVAPPVSSNPYLYNPNQLNVGDVGEAFCYGFTDAIITMRTRLTSTDSWASANSVGAGDALIPETIGNALQWVSSNLLFNQNYVVLGQSAASIVSNVSTYGATNLKADTYRMKVFVRAM